MKQIVFASQNPHKIAEINQMLQGKFEVISAPEAGLLDEIPETGNNLKENALIKAQYVYNKLGKDCFADDTGLEVEALNGEPGVYSARYAGPQKNAADNMALLLQNLTNNPNRNARFVTVIAYIENGQTHIFEGEVKGQIITQLRGSQGFGYDPVFQPDGTHLTFAEMPPEAKNTISHRQRAVQKLVEFLTH